jgi:hypothetical protein
MGFQKAEKSRSPKECVRPSKLIVARADAVEPLAIAQDAPKPSPHPFVDHGKVGSMIMLEVFKPTSQVAVSIFDNLSQTAFLAARGFGSDGIFELLHAFRARPSSGLFKVVAEKVEPFSGKAHMSQSGLFRVQSKSALCGRLAERIEDLLGFVPSAAQNHEIVRPTGHFKSRICHGGIDGVEVEIGKQRTDHSPMLASFLRGPQVQILKKSRSRP